MSSRLHNKFHRHNHHTTSVNNPSFPDASYDPIASYTSPFVGPLVVQNSTQSATKYTTTQASVAIDAGGDIISTGSISIDGKYFGDGSQLALGNNSSLIATVTGTPFVYGASNPVTSIVSSITGTSNSATAQYSTVAGGSANQILGSGAFSFIAAGSSNQTNVPNTFILGSNIIATSNQPNYTYVNNLSSLGFVYATTIGASSVNAKHLGDGSLLNLSTNSLSATTTSLVNTTSGNLVTLTNTVSTTLNASITSLSATTTTLVNSISGKLVTNTAFSNYQTSVASATSTLNSVTASLQSLSSNWQNVYTFVNTATATTLNVNNLNATTSVSATYYYSTGNQSIISDGYGNNDILGNGYNTLSLNFLSGTYVANQLTVTGPISATGLVTGGNVDNVFYFPNNGGVISTTSITPYFSADSLLPSKAYEVEYHMYYNKGTNPSVITYTLSSNRTFTNVVGNYQHTTTIGTISGGTVVGQTGATVAFSTLPADVVGNYFTLARFLIETNSLGNTINMCLTDTATSLQLLRGSYRKIKRID
jgi:hypothetical protein